MTRFNKIIYFSKTSRGLYLLFSGIPCSLAKVPINYLKSRSSSFYIRNIIYQSIYKAQVLNPVDGS